MLPPGVRRIEAVVGLAALDYLKARDGVLVQLQDLLQTQVGELPHQVESLLEENKELKKEMALLKQKKRPGCAGRAGF